MVLESTIVCVDNSDYMRNGDFIPTRLQAQQDAVSMVCHSKTRSNPENNVGLVVMSNVEVLATLTTEVGRILTKLHQVSPKGNINFMTAVRVAHLALKHRLGRNHKTRIVVFVGSPIEDDVKELVKVAKKLKKEKVGVDIVNFGEESLNTEKLTQFINTINGKDGTGSHLVTVPPGPMLSDALLSSPIVLGEGGSGPVAGMSSGGYEFGIDPNEDPELALALRVSMEEQRARQEEETRKSGSTPATDVTTKSANPTTEEASLEQTIAMAMEGGEAEREDSSTPVVPDFATMTEDQQIAYALQMSMQPGADGESSTPMDVDMEEEPDDGITMDDKKEEDYSEVMNDPAFLQSVLESLPGVDPQSEAIRNAVGTLTQGSSGTGAEKKDDAKKDEKNKEQK